MAGICGPLCELDPARISVSGWVQLFNEYCAVNNVLLEPPANANGVTPHNRRRALFITFIGPRAFEHLRAVCLPRQPNSYPIRELVEFLKARFEPEGLETTNRFQFSQRNQQANETASDFIAALQVLAAKCNFGMFYFDALRDRLVAGLKSNELRLKLLSQDNLTFLRAKELAIREDAIRQEARILAQSSVNHVSRQQRQPKNPTPSSDDKQNQKWKPCYRCSRLHDPAKCPARHWTCHACNIKGHISKACRKKANKSQAKSSVKNVEAEDSQQTAQPTLEQEVEALFHVSQVN